MLTLAFGTKQQGFSLLELMIVLVLAGLLSGVVATNMSRGPVLRKAVHDVSSSLRHARNLALIQHRSIVWKINLVKKSYGFKALNTKQLDHDLSIQVDSAATENTQPNMAGIRFFPDGSSTGGKVDIIYKKQRYSINVEWLSGRVSIQ